VITSEAGAPRGTRARVALPTALVLVGLTAVALALRLPSFGDSLWGDEVGTNYVVNGFGVGSVLHIVGTDQEGTPPLFFWLAWLTKWFDGVEGLRVPSLLAGLAAVPLTYALGRRTAGLTAGLVGAALIALSPFQIFYATEARAYELVMLFCLLAAVTLLRALDTGRWQWWLAYGASAAAALYTHYNAFFVLAVLFGWAFFAHPEGRRPQLLANAGAALAFAPWLSEFFEDSDEPAAKLTGLLRPLSLQGVKEDVLKWGAGHPNIPIADLPGHLALWLGVAALVIGAVALLVRLPRELFEDWGVRPRDAILAPILALAAPVGALIWSLFNDSIFVPRALITSWPGLAVTLGALATAGRPPIRYVTTALMLAAFAIGAVQMLDRDNQRPDLADAVSFIERSGPPDSPIVDQPQPTPGPQTNLAAALAPKGKLLPSDRPLFEIGFPTTQTLIEARRNGTPILTPHPTPSPEAIAREAARLAGNGKIFLVTWGTASLDVFQRTPGEVGDFLNALPPRFHEVEFRTFPGLWINAVGVHVLSGAP
jgi:mannosyltransferase